MYVLHIPISCYQEVESDVQSPLWGIAMRHVWLHTPISCYQEVGLDVQSLLWEIAMRHVCATHTSVLLSGD
jgi:hypothetical protein